MDTIEIKLPALGESVVEATVGKWLKQPKEEVSSNTVLVEIETDKVTLEVYAPEDGYIDTILIPSGTIVKVGATLATFVKVPISDSVKTLSNNPQLSTQQEVSMPKSAPIPTPSPLSNYAQRDVHAFIASAAKKENTNVHTTTRAELRVPMSTIRQRIAERLKQAQNTAAVLTTFNEIDLTSIIALRTKYKEAFEKKHQVKLGFMSFFVKACVEALKAQPIVNSCIDGNDIITKSYHDIGIAVSTSQGLVVPIVRDADTLSLSEIEQSIEHFSQKARDNKLSVEDVTGGTFTITNGGVFGSLLSTPILNPPQSAILGMHKIQERPVVVDGQIVIRSMMYVALSYDHRLIDGKDAVTFLVTVKECLENPGRFLLGL